MSSSLCYRIETGKSLVFTESITLRNRRPGVYAARARFLIEKIRWFDYETEIKIRLLEEK